MPSGIGVGDDASVVAGGSGPASEVVGAGMMIVVSETAGVCERVGSAEGDGVASGVGV